MLLESSIFRDSQQLAYYAQREGGEDEIAGRAPQSIGIQIKHLPTDTKPGAIISQIFQSIKKL